MSDTTARVSVSGGRSGASVAHGRSGVSVARLYPSVDGALTLPELQLAGSVTPTVSVSSAATLPNLQLAGSVAPTVGAVTGALTLPELQVSGSFVLEPSQLSAVGSWLRVANATVTGSGVSSLPDMLNTNPAVQATDARRPPVATSANGLPILTFATDNSLQWPLIAANNSTTTFGWALWWRPTAATTEQRIISIYNGGGASAHKAILTSYGTILGVTVYDLSGTGAARHGTFSLPFVAGTWYGVSFEYDSAKATEADRMALFVGGTKRTLSISSFGTPGTITTLANPTGLARIGVLIAPSTHVLEASLGPNIYAFHAKMAGATEGLLTTDGRTALMSYEAPT